MYLFSKDLIADFKISATVLANNYKVTNPAECHLAPDYFCPKNSDIERHSGELQASWDVIRKTQFLGDFSFLDPILLNEAFIRKNKLAVVLTFKKKGMWRPPTVTPGGRQQDRKHRERPIPFTSRRQALPGLPEAGSENIFMINMSWKFKCLYLKMMKVFLPTGILVWAALSPQGTSNWSLGGDLISSRVMQRLRSPPKTKSASVSG